MTRKRAAATNHRVIDASEGVSVRSGPRRAGRLRVIREGTRPSMGTSRLVGGTVLFLAVATFCAANVGTAAAPAGCSRLNKVPSIFPGATKVGFVKRSVIAPLGARQPIWPGWCGRTSWWTTYAGPKGSVDVRVALYATPHDVEAALAEPAYGPVQAQSNGARIRTTTRATGTSTTPGVVSAYRNLFVSSSSGYGSARRVPIVVQWRIHHAIHTAYDALR